MRSYLLAVSTLCLLAFTLTSPGKASAEYAREVPTASERVAYQERMRQRVGQFFRRGKIKEGLHAIEESHISELEQFLGRNVANTPSPPPIKKREMQEASQKSGSPSALVYPVILPDRLVVVAILPTGEPILREVRVAPESVIRPTIEEFRNNLQDPTSQDYLEQAQKLYSWIVRPIEADLDAGGIETLVFVLDGGLRAIPVAAFHNGKDFLIAKYAVAVVPSSRFIDLTQGDRRQSHLLAMGLSEAVQGLSALPSVPVEIQTISLQLLSGSFFLNQPFTPVNLLRERRKQKATIVHLATHAQFAADRADRAFIQFWDSRLNVGEIGKLGLNDPPVDLVVLSACQTAVGANLGIGGFALNSGARSVLASLWPVSDAGTAPLMMSFYGAWRSAPSKAIALQRAQLAMLKGTVRLSDRKIVGIAGLPPIALPSAPGKIDLKHPFFWSPFILLGNWL